MKILLPEATEYQLLQCRLFADHVIDTNESTYRVRSSGGKNAREKIKKDIYNGKVMECRVFNYLEAKQWNSKEKPTPIDFTIYGVRRKTFDADLSLLGKKYHIKSCLGGSPFPNSWLFQKSDPLLHRNNNDDMLFLCVENPDGSYGYVIGMSEELPLREPVLPQLRSNKVAVYEDDLITYDN